MILSNDISPVTTKDFSGNHFYLYDNLRALGDTTSIITYLHSKYPKVYEGDLWSVLEDMRQESIVNLCTLRISTHFHNVGYTSRLRKSGVHPHILRPIIDPYGISYVEYSRQVNKEEYL